MKKYLLYIIASLSMISFTIALDIGDIIASLKTGSAAGIAKNFDNTVEITLPGKTGSFSKSQADLILRDFFENNTVKSFTILHRGNNGGSEYCIGTLATKTGNFRTTVYMKQKADKQALQEIRFELN